MTLARTETELLRDLTVIDAFYKYATPSEDLEVIIVSQVAASGILDLAGKDLTVTAEMPRFAQSQTKTPGRLLRTVMQGRFIEPVVELDYATECNFKRNTISLRFGQFSSIQQFPALHIVGGTTPRPHVHDFGARIPVSQIINLDFGS